MAKFKMKLDMSTVKQYFFEKGEKVGLIACLAIMALVVVYSLYSGFSSRGTDKGEEWSVALTKAASNLDRAIQSASVTETPPKIAQIDWLFMPYGSQFLPFSPAPDKVSTKKLNPLTWPLRTAEDEKVYQLNYYATGTIMYDIDTARKNATVIGGGGGGAAAPGGAPGMALMQPKGLGGAQGGGISNLAKTVRPTRMVVVSAIFPMQDQLEEHRKTLRYASLPELLAHRDELPKPVGLEVYRCEILPDGQPKKNSKGEIWTTKLFYFDKGKLIVDPQIKDMMLRMLVDEDEPRAAAPYIFPGLVTPMPKLAHGHYVKLDLKGFDVKEVVAGADGDNKNPMVGMGGLGMGKPGFGGPAMPGMQGKKGPVGPGMEQPGAAPAVAGQDIRLHKEPWKKLGKDLQLKFEGNFNVFDPLGLVQAGAAEKKGWPAQGGFMPKDGVGAAASVFGWDYILGGAGAGAGMFGGGKEGVPPGMPPRGDEGMGEGERPPAGAGAAPVTVNVNINDALVRFFDPTVEPGKAYAYTIRVRMANPNYGKKTEVAFDALAKQKHLDPMPTASQGWVITPAVAIPPDYHWYAVDQAPEVKIKLGADYTAPPLVPESAPVQVHRWMGTVTDPNRNDPWLTADWAIAERLHTRRGDPIGRPSVMIEMPTWNLPIQAFDIGVSALGARGKGKAPQPSKTGPIESGIPVELTTTPPTLLIDFDGGKKSFVEKRDGAKEYVADVSAMNLLALTADGRLVVRNSRIDSDAETGAGAERKERYDAWRERVADLRAPPAGAGGVGEPPMGNPMPPGMKKGGERGQ